MAPLPTVANTWSGLQIRIHTTLPKIWSLGKDKDGATVDNTCYGLQKNGSPLPNLKFGLRVRIKDGATEANTCSGLQQDGSLLPGLKFGLWVRIKDGATEAITCGC